MKLILLAAGKSSRIFNKIKINKCLIKIGKKFLIKHLIDNAKKSGCDAIKFQSFLPNTRVSKFLKTEKYVEKIIGTQESIGEFFERLSLNFKTQKKIFEYARNRKLLIFRHINLLFILELIINV